MTSMLATASLLISSPRINVGYSPPLSIVVCLMFLSFAALTILRLLFTLASFVFQSVTCAVMQTQVLLSEFKMGKPLTLCLCLLAIFFALICPFMACALALMLSCIVDLITCNNSSLSAYRQTVRLLVFICLLPSFITSALRFAFINLSHEMLIRESWSLWLIRGFSVVETASILTRSNSSLYVQQWRMMVGALVLLSSSSLLLLSPAASIQMDSIAEMLILSHLSMIGIEGQSSVQTPHYSLLPSLDAQDKE